MDFERSWENDRYRLPPPPAAAISSVSSANIRISSGRPPNCNCCPSRPSDFSFYRSCSSWAAAWPDGGRRRSRAKTGKNRRRDRRTGLPRAPRECRSAARSASPPATIEGLPSSSAKACTRSLSNSFDREGRTGSWTKPISSRARSHRRRISLDRSSSIRCGNCHADASISTLRRPLGKRNKKKTKIYLSVNSSFTPRLLFYGKLLYSIQILCKNRARCRAN